MNRPASAEEKAVIELAIARLRAGILAIVCGLMVGTVLALATIWLVIRGGPNVGQHLSLLANYLPGYSVTWSGALLGFVYGAVLGAIAGWMVGWIYNRLVSLRHS